MTLPPIALSCGEPAGIGLELAEKAWADLGESLPFFLVGDPAHLPGREPHVLIEHAGEAAVAAARGLPVMPLAFEGRAVPGQPDPDNAAGVMDAIAMGVDLVIKGEASALCTAPIHKKALKDGQARLIRVSPTKGGQVEAGIIEFGYDLALHLEQVVQFLLISFGSHLVG